VTPCADAPTRQRFARLTAREAHPRTYPPRLGGAEPHRRAISEPQDPSTVCQAEPGTPQPAVLAASSRARVPGATVPALLLSAPMLDRAPSLASEIGNHYHSS
jgi:hypothetical protein